MLKLGGYAAVLGAFGAISVKAPSFPQSSIAGISMGPAICSTAPGVTIPWGGVRPHPVAVVPAADCGGHPQHCCLCTVDWQGQSNDTHRFLYDVS